MTDWQTAWPYLAAAFFSWNFTVLSLPLLRKYSVSAPRLNSVDKGQVPGGGGIITLAIIAVFWLSGAAFLSADNLSLLLAAASLLAVVSWIDDKHHVHWPWRLGLHLGLATLGSLLLLDEFGGLLLANALASLFDYRAPIWADVVFAVAFWVTIINFLNFIDASDGALASQALGISVGTALAALLVDNAALASGGFIVAAALLGFLVVNFPPATVFCGNSGAAALGYICGLLLLTASAGGLWYVALILPAYFCADETVVLLKRLFNRQPLWQSGRTNTLHILILKGYSHRRAFFLFSGFALALIGLALLAAAGRSPFWQLAMVAVAWTGCLSMVFVLHKLPTRRKKLKREVKFVTIKRALISVSDKKALTRLVKTLSRFKVEIIASGGTAEAIAKLGVSVRGVSSITGFPEIFGGRVKTLHPRIHGAILMRRHNAEDRRQADAHQIKPLDLVVVDLYPFAEALSENTAAEKMVEYIDIGGAALLRAAAKNYLFVTVASSAADQISLEEALIQYDGRVPLSLRRVFAARTFRMLQSYDEKIATWLGGDANSSAGLASIWQPPGRFKAKMRYGENPHQLAELHEVSDGFGLVQAELLQGRLPSYNNYQDGDAAMRLTKDLALLAPNRAAAVIVKHATPCAAAVADDTAAAWRKAYGADSESAFGGICAFSKPVDAATAKQLAELFLEVIIAPNFQSAALKILRTKKNLRLFAMPNFQPAALEAKRISGGWLVQQSDLIVEREKPKCVTIARPQPRAMDDLALAWLVAKHARSNAVAIVANGVTLGLGSGQTSRVEAVRQAVARADTRGGAVAASDGFFPFADSIGMLAAAGVEAVIQPGGSRRDKEVIAAANAHKMAMLVTGTRHFRH